MKVLDNLSSFRSDYEEPIPLERQQALIYANGTVYVYNAAIATYLCALDVTDFPFDSQTCSIKYGTYYSVIEEIELVGSKNPTLAVSSMGSNAWSVVEIQIVNYNFTDARRGWTFPEVPVGHITVGN